MAARVNASERHSKWSRPSARVERCSSPRATRSPHFRPSCAGAGVGEPSSRSASAAERELIWQRYGKKYGVSGERPDDEGLDWSGNRQGVLQEGGEAEDALWQAAQYTVPISKSAAEQVKSLRQQASGVKFISASNAGLYPAGGGEYISRRQVAARPGQGGINEQIRDSGNRKSKNRSIWSSPRRNGLPPGSLSWRAPLIKSSGYERTERSHVTASGQELDSGVERYRLLQRLRTADTARSQ